jgi:hypothetical protein
MPFSLAGRVAERKSCTTIPLKRAYNSCRNRFCTILIDTFRTAYTQQENVCTLELAYKKRAKACMTRDMEYSRLTDRSIARQSLVRRLLCCASTSHSAPERFLHRDSIT